MNKNSICKLNSCSARFNRDEVARIYGKDSRPHLLGYCSAGCYTFSKDSPLKNEIDHPHDYYEKGKLFDALKKRNVELVEALELLMTAIDNGKGYKGYPVYDKAQQLIKQLK